MYNYFANLLNAVGNSVTPLYFFAVAALSNIGLDLLFVLVFKWGIGGAAWATVIAQLLAGIGIAVYTLNKFPHLRPQRADMCWNKADFASIVNLSVMTSVQQSIMNFGILLVQGLVNSFGSAVMAAFAAAKNRFFCLYAGIRFWQRLFYVCSPKLWRSKVGAHPFGHSQRSANFGSILFAY